MELFAFDDDYVRRLREGDPATEAHFSAYFRDLLLIKLRRKLSSSEAIDDLRQEIFARTFEKLTDLQDGRKLGAFVNVIANHVLMEYYRRSRRGEVLNAENIYGLVALPYETPVPDRSVAPIISIVWDPSVIDADEYAELVTAVGDLVRASGGAGLKRITSETLNLEHSVSVSGS